MKIGVLLLCGFALGAMGLVRSVGADIEPGPHGPNTACGADAEEFETEEPACREGESNTSGARAVERRA